jgi:hypothetical protein
MSMIEATYKGVKIELEIKQNEDGNWAAWCSLKWSDGRAEHFAGKYALGSEQSAHASALEQVNPQEALQFELEHSHADRTADYIALVERQCRMFRNGEAQAGRELDGAIMLAKEATNGALREWHQHRDFH